MSTFSIALPDTEYTLEDIKVGQVWCWKSDNSHPVLVSMVKGKEIIGHMFDGFQIVNFHHFDPDRFLNERYMLLDRK